MSYNHLKLIKNDPYEKWNSLGLTEKIKAQNLSQELLSYNYPTDILSQIFYKDFIKRYPNAINDYIQKSNNPIIIILLIFFRSHNENKEYIEKEYLRLIDYINSTYSLFPQYSSTYYLNKLDQIYKYKLEYKKIEEEEEKIIQPIIFPQDDGIALKSKYSSDHPLTKIFDRNWRSSVGIKENVLRLINDHTNPINSMLLEFFQSFIYERLSDEKNIEYIQQLYIYIFNYIKRTSSNYREYSEKCYLNKLKEIYIYLIIPLIEKKEFRKPYSEEDTILIKINSFAFMSENLSSISTCKICYEFYKIIYDYIKKYIRKYHKKYPKFTKDEYLKILEETYKLKLDSCRNKFKILEEIKLMMSSSSSSSNSSSSSTKYI